MGHYTPPKRERLPGDPPPPPKQPEMRTTWRCECGRAVLQHYAYCENCCAPRPDPEDFV